MSETRMNYEQVVSGGDLTIQNFDFLTQTLDQMITNSDCDPMLLCQLLKIYADSKQFVFNEPIRQLSPTPN